jgi:diguanylate cyclase (GGDEF)-like protein
MPMTTTHRVLIASAAGLQIAHGLVFAVLRDASLTSNLLQVSIALLCAICCLFKAKEFHQLDLLSPWALLSLAFFLWTAGQMIYLLPLISVELRLWGALSNVLWLVFSFPLLLASFGRTQGSRRDGANWLDLAQACLFFSTLFALVYLQPSVIGLSTAYEVQSIALALAFALRYSTSLPGEERLFYRNAAIFSISYAVFSVAGYISEDHGYPSGTAIDLCWTLPFSIFSVLAIRFSSTSDASHISIQLKNPSSLHGICAFGLATMSLAASGLLAWRHPLCGGAAVFIAFGLLAARMIAREFQLHQFQIQLESLALCDRLTGLANRTSLELKLIDSRKQTVHNRDEQTVVLFIDLDRFKIINDGFGHHFGDLVLKRVAELLNTATRTQDLVARQGGDEFVVLLDRISIESALEVAERITMMLRKPIHINDRTVHLSASVGLASGRYGEDRETLLEDADCAMYKAKSMGRDRIEQFTPELLKKVQGTHSLYSDLREALAKGQIIVHYQPIYQLDGDAITGFEALARWQHPERGFIAPSDFIPIAEESGMIVELGEHVLQTACLQCKEWISRFKRDLTMSVNVSARQFADSEFSRNVMAILTASELKPQLLRLEITETVLLGGYEGIGKTLEDFRATGIAISLDDFGTGYSSLSYLLNFPFDVVKIDRSFVSNIDSDLRRSEIVRKIIQLAGILEMKTIAEGVETSAEMSCLRELQCDMVQGYLLSRPITHDRIFDLLSSTAQSVTQGLSEGDPPYCVDVPFNANIRTHVW